MIALFLFVIGGLSLLTNLKNLIILDEAADAETVNYNLISCAVQSALLTICVGGGIGQLIYSFM